MSSDSKPLCFSGCGEIGTLRCARCLDAFYCGKVCQADAWPNHKGTCKEAAKARAAVEEMEAKQKLEATAATTSSSSVTLCAKGCGEVATLRCPRCLGAWYCSKECFTIAWPDHKGQCKDAVEMIAGRSIDEFDKDFERYKRQAEAGNAAAQYNLGLCYFYGTGVAVNMHEAIKLFTRAAEAGNMTAQYNLGICYYNGHGVAVDKREAVKWYMLAAKAGSTDAQNSLGLCYEQGDGVAVNMHEAIKWYTLAAKGGDSSAQYNLGICYNKGNGVAVDNREAVKWLKLSAEGGNMDAQNFIDQSLVDKMD